MKSSQATFLAAAILSAVLFSAPGPARADLAADSETADLIYLADKGPIFLRLRILVEGVGYKTVWNIYVDHLFEELDKDKDGQLDRTEAIAVQPIRQALLAQRAAGSTSRSLPGTPDFSPRDGKVSREELGRFIKRLGGGPLQINVSNNSMARGVILTSDGRAMRQTPASGLFKRLDRNEDGKLAAEEFTFDVSLKKLDLDDDGTLSRAELQPLQLNRFLSFAGGNRRNQPSSSFLSLDRDTSTTALVRRLLDRYDSSESKEGKDNKLSTTELGVKQFGETDADGDGQLDFDELRQMLRNPLPSIEAVIRIGKRVKGKKAVEIISSRLESQAALRTSPGGAVALVLGQTQIEFVGSGPAGWPVNLKDFYTQRFKQADTDNNAYLEKKETERNPYFRNTFDAMDADNDGKLFEKELLSYVNAQSAAAQSRVVLGIADQGRDLFGILDVNRDNRLTQRELAAGREKIANWDEDADKLVAEAEIPRSYRLSLERGRPGITGVPVAVRASSFNGQLPPQTAGGPIWFQKMDRNRDGDVSRREFLGSIADFAKIDANNDGLIDAVEATNAK